MDKKPGRINMDDFRYDLPHGKIAGFPLKERDSSKLLLYENGEISTNIFRDLPSLIENKYNLVFNNTKVIRARILFKSPGGSMIEVFLLEPYDPSDYERSFSGKNESVWTCLVGNAKKWKAEFLEKRIELKDVPVHIKVKKLGRYNDAFILRFTWEPEISFSEIISLCGTTPIPPYLSRDATAEDVTRYQTVYSIYEGSVAAPTAGLHFTDGVLEKLDSKGIKRIMLTLHVGAGTFMPVKQEDASLHKMHAEKIVIDRQSIIDLISPGKDLFAIGTTSVRTLESLYWIGVKIRKSGIFENSLDQWEWCGLDEKISRQESLEAILNHMDNMGIDLLQFSTRIMIVPGYEFRMIKGLITNFHQPGSTLLLLIAAFVGDDWKKIYDYALRNDYRFLSYGDSSLLIPSKGIFNFASH